MTSSRASLLVVTLASLSAVVVSASCSKADAQPQGQLPPAGLAGGGTGTAPLALPGAGVPVADPSGGTPSTQLPPGHPPIPGMDTGAAGGGDASANGADHPGLPAGHPSMPGAGATDPGAAGGDNAVLTGSVLETMDVPEYTYMRLKTQGGSDDTWVAVTKTPIAVGDVVTVNQSLVMTDFFSKGLNRTFPKLVMGMMVGAPKKP